jgi:hypothetical protein
VGVDELRQDDIDLLLMDFPAGNSMPPCAQLALLEERKNKSNLALPSAIMYRSAIELEVPGTRMAFKLVPKGRIRSLQGKPPHISISSPGRLNLSAAAVELLTRDHVYEYALLYWDNEAGVVALRPIRKKDQRAYTILYNKTGRNVAIQAKSFFDYIGYDYSQTRSFLLTWNEAEAAFEINLRQGDKTQRKTFPVVERSAVGPKVPRKGALDLASWYTRAEVCERLRISKRTLDRIVREGGIEKQYRPCRGKRSEVVFNPQDVNETPWLFRKGRRGV